MRTPLDELTQSDYEILGYISKFDSISKEQILKQFKNIEAVEHRLSLLSKYDYGRCSPIENSSYIIEEFDEVKENDFSTRYISKDFFHITQLGKKTLQDYIVKKKIDNRRLWLKNAWIPIIVSLATNLVINVLKWSLPLIKQWLSSSL